MMSKPSFWIDLRENMKRRLWPLLLVTILQLFSYPIAMAITLANVRSYSDGNDEYLVRNLMTSGIRTMSSEIGIFVAMMAAFLLAMQGFGYVYHRVQVDMLQAQPVSPRRRFGVIYVGGFLVWFAPTLVCMILAVLIAIPMGGFSGNMLLAGLGGLWRSILGFLAVYHMTTLAVMMTGHLVVGCLATAVFAGFEVVLRLLIHGYMGGFFDTFYEQYGMSDIVGHSLTSPVITLFMVVVNAGWSLEYVKLFIQIIAYLALAYYAYRKRPMEAAGKAMAFEKTKLPIYLALVFMGALMGGVLFSSLVYDRTTLFCAFGMVIGAILTHILVQIIYNFDVRSVVKNLAPLAGSLAAALVLLVIFVTDVFGYDRYVPKVDQVRDLAVRFEFNNMYRSNYLDENAKLDYDGWNNARERVLETMKIKDPAVVLALAERHMGKDKAWDDYSHGQYVVVKYRLRCGRVVYREFIVDLVEDADLLNALFADPDFKNGLSQVDDEVMAQYAATAIPYFNNSFKEIPVRDDNSLALLEAYRQDYLDMTYDEAYNEIPVGFLEMTRKNEYGRPESIEFTVLPSFTRTIEFLKEHKSYETSSIDIESISSVTVTWYEEVEYYDTSYYDVEPGDNTTYYTTDRAVSEEFSDAEKLNEIVPYLVPTELADRAFVASGINWNLDVIVEGADNDAGYAADYNAHGICFVRDRIPGIVSKLMESENAR